MRCNVGILVKSLHAGLDWAAGTPENFRWAGQPGLDWACRPKKKKMITTYYDILVLVLI